MRRFLFRLSSTFFLYWLIPGLAIAQDKKFSINAILNPPAIQNGTDLSIHYLGLIFGVVDGVLHGGGTQIMGQMFGILNTAALVLGGIIIIFTMMISLLNTANEGEVLGRKWSSVWIPLRSVLGIALLLPKATGYSIIQIFMMWVIVQGVAVGDSVWNAALGYLNAGGVIISKGEQPTKKNLTAAKDIYNLQVCMYGVQAALRHAYNKSLLKSPTPPTIPVTQQSLPAPPSLINTVLPIPKNATSAKFPGGTVLPGKTNIPKAYKYVVGTCGSISWKLMSTDTKNKDTNNTNANINKYKIAAIQQIIMDTALPAQLAVNNLLNLDNKPSTASQDTYFPKCTIISTGLEKQISPYQCKLFSDTALNFRSIMLQTRTLSDTALKGSYQEMEDNGWLTAGSYFLDLTNAAGKITNVKKALTGSIVKNTTKLKNDLSKHMNLKIAKDIAKLVDGAITFSKGAVQLTPPPPPIRRGIRC